MSQLDINEYFTDNKQRNAFFFHYKLQRLVPLSHTLPTSGNRISPNFTTVQQKERRNTATRAVQPRSTRAPARPEQTERLGRKVKVPEKVNSQYAGWITQGERLKRWWSLEVEEWKEQTVGWPYNVQRRRRSRAQTPHGWSGSRGGRALIGWLELQRYRRYCRSEYRGLKPHEEITLSWLLCQIFFFHLIVTLTAFTILLGSYPLSRCCVTLFLCSSLLCSDGQSPRSHNFSMEQQLNQQLVCLPLAYLSTWENESGETVPPFDFLHCRSEVWWN